MAQATVVGQTHFAYDETVADGRSGHCSTRRELWNRQHGAREFDQPGAVPESPRNCVYVNNAVQYDIAGNVVIASDPLSNVTISYTTTTGKTSMRFPLRCRIALNQMTRSQLQLQHRQAHVNDGPEWQHDDVHVQ